MAAKKITATEMDDQFILDSMNTDFTYSSKQSEKKTDPPEESAEKKPKEPSNRKRSPQTDYSETFLQRNEINIRKCVYISREVHEMISNVVRYVAPKPMSIGGYIDTVLTRHLEAHRDEVNELYRKSCERDSIV